MNKKIQKIRKTRKDDMENGRVTSHEDTMKILMQRYNDYVLL